MNKVVGKDEFYVLHKIEKDGKKFLHQILVPRDRKNLLLKCLTVNGVITVLENSMCQVE